MTEQIVIQPKRPTGPDPPQYPAEGPRPLIDNSPGDVNFEEEQWKPKLMPPPSSHLPPTRVSKLVYKLRWANLGYSYHWGSKSYDFTRPKTAYPENLQNTCKRIVASVNWRDVWDETKEEDWGEAGPDWEQWTQTYGG